MSTVLEFTLRLKGKKAALPEGSSAQIIIFPGVRFERLLGEDDDIFEPTEPHSPQAGHRFARGRAAK
ncbi:MAG: hypothetical protein JNM45_06650 [Rhizobiales bacterium]|nr:hypothetical protein [Hyphomicrobiales bacterium]